MRRLEELLRQMIQAAKNIGNTELENKFSESIKLLKRDIVFAASLYLQNKKKIHIFSLKTKLRFSQKIFPFFLAKVGIAGTYSCDWLSISRSFISNALQKLGRVKLSEIIFPHACRHYPSSLYYALARISLIIWLSESVKNKGTTF